MYQSDSFFIGAQNGKTLFFPAASSAFQIFTDSSYIHFCDDEEKNMHPKDTTAFIKCTSGCGKIYTKDGNFTLNENDFIFLHFHDILKYKAKAQIWAYRWVNFSPCGSPEFKYNAVVNQKANDYENAAFNRLLLAGQLCRSRNYINGLCCDYIYSVIAREETEKLIPNTEHQNRQIDDICNFISQKLYSKITVDTVAEFFGISPRRLHQIFTYELQISPKKYILKKKMEEGYRLLVQTSMPINKISELLCFSSPYHFTNEFKNIFLQTPTEVRTMEEGAAAAKIRI